MQMAKRGGAAGKKASVELSVGTMVVIVIAVVLLILALTFVGRIFKGATYNVDQLNEAVRDKINNLFKEEGQRVVFYLPGLTAEIKQGESYGIAFGVKNSGASAADIYYVTNVEESGCSQVSRAEAENWIILGKGGRRPDIPSGKVATFLIKIQTPEDAPLGCQVRYNIAVTLDDKPYESPFFDVKIV